MIYLGAALLAALGVAVTAFYSGSETGLYTVNRFRLRRRAHRGERSARVLVRLLRDPVGLLATLLLGHNLAVFLTTEVVTLAYERAGLAAGGSWWRSPDVAATFTLILPLFIFAEVLPKNYFRRHAERLSYLAGWGLAATKVALILVIWPLKAVARLVPAEHGPSAGLGLPHLTRQIVDHLLSRGRETGELTAEQERLARNVLRSGESRVARLARRLDGSCCTAESETKLDPAVRTLTVPADETAGRLLPQLIAAHARLALVLDRPTAAGGVPQPPLNDAEVLGYVRLFDLLAPGAQAKTARSLVHPVPRLGAQTTLRVALNTMQRECADVALVEAAPPGASRRTAAGAPGSPEDGRTVLGVVRLAQLIAELCAAPGALRPATLSTASWPAVPR